MEKYLVKIINMYQAVSGFIWKQGPVLFIYPECKFYPSCSQYAIDAIHKHGPRIGLMKAAWRVLRCNPLSVGGVDEV